MHLRLTVRRSLAALAVTGLLFAACGDDDGDDPTPDTTPDTTPTTDSGTPNDPTNEPPTEEPTAEPTDDGTTPGTPDDVSAIEIAAQYFRALDAGNLEDAYLLWSGDGAASGMSLAEFQEAYAGIDGVSVLFESTDAGAGTAMLSGRLLQVAESEGGAQAATQATVQVALQHDDEAWRIAAVETMDETGLDAPPDDVADPATVVEAYYAAVEAGDLVAAYSLWAGTGDAAPEAFGPFAEGYQDTAGVTIVTGEAETEGAAGTLHATVPVAVAAVDGQGNEEVFCGAYELSQANVEPFDTFGWRLDSGDLEQVEGSAAEDLAGLLSRDCAPA